MSQPLFDPLDAAVLARALVPWTSGLLAAEAADRRRELMQRTTEADTWRWAGISDVNDLAAPARPARRDYAGEALRAWLARLRTAVGRPFGGPGPAKLAHGEQA